ncbi:hypothetical protein KEM52_000156 [Ascosphaera acerosa]|nr:hypothetical protein KEM52_000156 [Ascosphaera acerosa]
MATGTGAGAGTGTVASIDAVFPKPAAPKPSSFAIKGFTVETQKLPILKAGPIDAMTQRLGIPVPEMIFGDNHVTISHARSGWSISFNAFDALDRVDKTGQRMLQVAHSSSWQKSRQNTTEEIKEHVKPFDWSYTTDYKGTTTTTTTTAAAGAGTTAHCPFFAPTDTPIPIELLKRPDPILLFDEIMLFEDELADNGISMLSAKIRVMPERLLLLLRFFMRLDGVLVRMRDTRVYIDFETRVVTREYVAKEEKYEVLAEVGDTKDVNVLAEMLPTAEKTLESVTLAE